MRTPWKPKTLALAEASAAVLEPAPTFAVDAEAIPPQVFGLTSYVEQVGTAPRVDRRTAMQVPAVKRCRDLIAGPLSTLPLFLIDSNLKRLDSPLFEQPERDVPRSVTMARTLEDVLFESIAWWYVTERDWWGYPTHVVRLDPRTVDVLADARVYITADGRHSGMVEQYPQHRDLIRFDSPNDALLVAGARAIRTAAMLDRAAANYADGTPPLSWFTPSGDADPGDEEFIRGILDAWTTARRTSATGYVPASLKFNEAGFDPEKLQLAEARQHAVLEIARTAGVDPEELGVSTTSRTYMNAFDRRKQFLDFTLGSYRAAIEDRLSMGDVTRRGQRARFDLDDFLRSDPKARWEAAKVGIEVGATTKEEVRADERKPPLAEQTPTPALPTPAEEPPA